MLATISQAFFLLLCHISKLVILDKFITLMAKPCNYLKLRGVFSGFGCYAIDIAGFIGYPSAYVWFCLAYLFNLYLKKREFFMSHAIKVFLAAVLAVSAVPAQADDIAAENGWGGYLRDKVSEGADFLSTTGSKAYTATADVVASSADAVSDLWANVIGSKSDGADDKELTLDTIAESFRQAGHNVLSGKTFEEESAVEPAKPASSWNPFKFFVDGKDGGESKDGALEAELEKMTVGDSVFAASNLFSHIKEDVMVRAMSINGDYNVGGFIDVDSSFTNKLKSSMFQRGTVGTDFSYDKSLGGGFLVMSDSALGSFSFTPYARYRNGDFSVVALASYMPMKKDGKEAKAFAGSLRLEYLMFDTEGYLVTAFGALEGMGVRAVENKSLAGLELGTKLVIDTISTELLDFIPVFRLTGTHLFSAKDLKEGADASKVSLDGRVLVKLGDYFSAYAGGVVDYGVNSKAFTPKLKVGFRVDI